MLDYAKNTPEKSTQKLYATGCVKMQLIVQFQANRKNYLSSTVAPAALSFSAI